jgi:hypothetical protein
MERPGLARRGRDMTLCIAAISYRDGAIVTVSDTMLSTQSRSFETAMTKFDPIAANWLMSFCGDPSIYSEMLLTVADEDRMQHQRTIVEMVAKIERAFDAILRRQIERTVLRTLGMTHADFMQHGLNYLGVKEFARLLRQVRQTSLAGCGKSRRIFVGEVA